MVHWHHFVHDGFLGRHAHRIEHPEIIRIFSGSPASLPPSLHPSIHHHSRTRAGSSGVSELHRVGAGLAEGGAGAHVKKARRQRPIGTPAPRRRRGCNVHMILSKKRVLAVRSVLRCSRFCSASSMRAPVDVVSDEPRVCKGRGDPHWRRTISHSHHRL